MKRIHERRKFRVAVIFAIFLVLCFGTIAESAERKEKPDDRAITGLSISEDDTQVEIMINGNRYLTYFPSRDPAAPILNLFFNRTLLRAPKTDFHPRNDIVKSVKAVQLEEKQKTVKIEILMAENTSPLFSRSGTDLRVIFKKADGLVSMRRKSVHRPPVRSVAVGGSATRLDTVYAAKLEDGLNVFIGADGPISNFKSFNTESPPRIIFDIFDVKSPYRKERIVPVETKWVKQVRYYGYPDRLRVVLETRKAYLSGFSAFTVENGLLVHVGSALKKKPEYTVAPSSVPKPATGKKQLQSVYASQVKNGVMVTVRANAPLTNFTSNTTENPARITFDIYDIENPFKEKKSFPVDTEWVKTVRQDWYPDRLHLEIETRKPYLEDFTAFPDRNGLVIQVGGTGRTTTASRTSGVTAESFPRAKAEKPVKKTGKPAWVNRIDFVDEGSGRSSLVIGTTHPIDYDVQKTSEKSLIVTLENTKIPGYRQRPLITTRFESAVDKIKPLSGPKGRKSTKFVVELREAVPFHTEQADNLLMIHFEGSTKEPEPMAGLPNWDTVLTRNTAAGEPSESMAPVLSESPSSEIPGKPDASSSAPVGMGIGESPSTDVMLSDTTGNEPASSLDSLLTEPKKKYTGEKIALDFYKTDIKNVFRILKEVSGKNFAIERDVTGEVTLTLDKPVPWDQVLDLVLKMNRLGMSMEGDIIRIATQATIQREEQERKKKLEEEQLLKEAQKTLEPLVTDYIPINYSDAASEISPHISKILSERGTVSVDKRTNMVIITDTADKIRQAMEIVEKLDRVTPQVIIEARIVEANTSFSRSFGTEWQTAGGIQNTDTNAGVGPERGFDALGGTYGYDMAINLPSSGATGTLGFNFMRLLGTPFLLDAQLMAAESENNVKIISTPKILTLDNKSASISQGLEIPYSTTSVENGVLVTTTSFKEVNLDLTVKPHVTPDNRISMQITVEKNDVSGVAQAGAAPPLTTKSAKTELLINDGDTLVIGGIIKTTSTGGNEGIPGLSKIPILGWLFKNKTDSLQKEELLIFITPRIVQLEQRFTKY